MKKTYIYFIVPLVCTAIFGVIYARYASVYEEKIAAAEAKIQKDRDEKRAEEARARDQAVKEATAATEKRKAERLAKEKKEAAEKEARQLAIQERDKAREDSRKFADNAKILRKEVEDTKQVIADIQRDQKVLEGEEGHLRELVKASDANVQSLRGVLEKIDAADKQRLANERAAAAKK